MIPITTELAGIAARVRAATVQVQGRRRGTWGSGVLWRPGVVVTNAHVVTGRSARVETADGTVHDARLLATDEGQDLALLAVSTELPPPALARDEPRVGALVVAVGNPLGLSGAVTAGIVHGRLTPRRGPPIILADLQLLPGNSGGPLADVLGRVVGVNTMMVRGLAAAIPCEVVERFVERAA